MRLIDADALAARYMSVPPDYYHTAHIVGEITSAPTVKTQGWISVKDALPEDEMVVVIVKHKIGWYRVPAWHDEFGWHSSAREFRDGEGKYVTHWMPLPEPPEKVIEDAD